MDKADRIIRKLELESHPEGGYYKETYRNDEVNSKESLPERYSSDRNYSTSIYYLLKSGEKSRLHKLESDEIWNFCTGSPIKLYFFHENGKYEERILDGDLDLGHEYQIIIPRGTVFGAHTLDNNSFSLCTCMVVPGFEFEDFSFANVEKLKEQFPFHHDIIDEMK